MKTFNQNPKQVKQQWFLMDADGKVLGRLATKIVTLLRGKDLAEFTPNVDMGREIVVINAAKISVTGKKMTDKMYQSYSGYPGGLKEISLQTMLKTKPEEVIRKAVWGMLPHNSLGRKLLGKLKVYAGAEHKHQAQKPQEINN